MTYQAWEAEVPEAIREDSLWKAKAYRLALFAADAGWHDVTKLTQDRRTRGLSDQLYRALGSVSANIAEGYVHIEGGEAWAENIHIPEYAEGTWTNHAPRRKRKLLLHHAQIDELAIRTRERGITIVPLRLYFLNGRAKLEIGVGRGKKLYDKRQALKERQDNREAQRAMAHRNRLGE